MFLLLLFWVLISCFKMGTITACMYVDKNNPVEMEYWCWRERGYFRKNFFSGKGLWYLVHMCGEDNGTLLQYSCLENPMDRGAWKAAVHGVAKSWAWQSDFTFTFHFHALEKKMAAYSSVLAWRIPGRGEPGGLSSMRSHRVRHNWSDLAAAAAAVHMWEMELPRIGTETFTEGRRQMFICRQASKKRQFLLYFS